MGDAPEVGHLPELTEDEQKHADALAKLVQEKVASAMASQIDTSTRPGFPAGDDKVDTKESKPSLKSLKRLAKSAPQGFNVNLFPKGDLDNFSVTRWAMAQQKSMNTTEGTQALRKHAPWETQYYAALSSYGESKAQGDMVSGQDGGFLAPEEWSQNFIDQLYPQMALSRLPIRRMPMGTRVVHMPKLTSNISISYGSENAALSPSQSQFAQLSFTARKQYAFVQISNELIRDSNPAAEAILTGNATKYIALDRDFQTLLGTGQGGAPVGLYNQLPSGQVSGVFSSPPAFGDFITAIDLVENLNNSASLPVGQASCTGIVGPASLKRQVTAMKDTTNNRPIYDFGINEMRYSNRPDGSSALDGLFGVDTWVLSNVVKNVLNSTPAQVTTNLNPGTTRGTQSPVFFGDWQHLIVMERQDVEIVTSNVAGTSFQNDQTWVRLISRYDVGVAHPEAFYVISNG